MVTKQQVDNAFKKLKAAGYFAEQNFLCCQSCAWSSIPEEEEDKVVFYHAQDNDAWNEDDGILTDKLYLAWSGDCEEIKSILEGEGLTVEHDGNPGLRIIILP